MNSLTETTVFSPDGLISGDYPIQHEVLTVKAGQSLKRGMPYGKIALGAASVDAGDGNQGGGTLTLDATPYGALAQAGDYSVTCIAEAANGGTFSVFAPDGARLADAVVGVAYAGDHVRFALADVGADFKLDDGFTITIAAGSGEAVLSVTSALDGSQRAAGILAEDADAALGAVKAPGYVSGQFDPAFLVLTNTGHTLASLRASFGDKPIFLRAAI